MDQEFEKYLRAFLQNFLKNKAEEIARVKLEWFYAKDEKELKNEKQKELLLQKLDQEVATIVEKYIQKFDEVGLDSAEKIKDNPKKVNEIVKEVEKELKKNLEAIK